MNLTFDLFPGRTLSLWLFGEVTPVVASSLSEKLRQKSLPPVAFINPKWITSLHQITTAALRSLQGETTGTMRTREIHTELVYTLAATKNITESLRKFGVSDKQESILVAQFDSSPEKIDSILAEVSTANPLSLPDNITQFTNAKDIASYYKLNETELAISGLDFAVCNKIVIHDV